MDKSFWTTTDGLYNRDPHTGKWLVIKDVKDIDLDLLPRAVCICGRPIAYMPVCGKSIDSPVWSGGWMHLYNTDDDPYPCRATPMH